MQQTRRPVSAERFFAILGCTFAAISVVVILLELSSFVVLSAYGRLHRDPLIPQKSPAYDSEKWGADFWAEQTSFWSKGHSNYLPFMVWGVRKWHGKYINSDDTEMGRWRRTTSAMSEKCTKDAVRRVWVFGGSTVHGIGTPDWATIPSYLSRELNADPSACMDVINLGAEGYVTNQEAILLMQQLKAGRKPDIAIFYDGVNESLVGGFSPGIPTEHWNFETIKAQFEKPAVSRLDCLNLTYSARLVKLLMENHRSQNHAEVSDGELARRAQATLQNYQANLKLVQIMAKAYGFKTYFFWQPVLAYGDKPLTPFEKQLKEARSQEFGGEVHRGLKAVYEQAESRSTVSGEFVFLGRAFDEVNELVYVDEFHLDPRGNEMIARVIAQRVRLGASSD